jgi:alanyl-tRNA synthetase
VGADAYQFLAREHVLVNRLTELLKVPADQIPERIERTIASLKTAERDLEKVRKSQVSASLDDVIGAGEDIGPVRVWAFQAPAGMDAAQLREVITQVKGRKGAEQPVVLFGTVVAEGKVSAIAAANDPAIALGVGANLLLASALPHLGGRGGGKPDLAQGGGTNPEGIGAALEAVRAAIASKVNS